MKGTPIYMAPEIFTEEVYSEASDVYAFACIIYEIFMLETPFKDENFMGVMKKVTEGYRPQIGDFVPYFFRKLIERCWSQKPQDRPSFNDIVNEMENENSIITEMVDELEFYDYIEFIEKYQCSFNSTGCLIPFENFVKLHGRNKTMKKISIDKKEIVQTIILKKENEKQSKVITQKNLIFNLNLNDKTASIIGYDEISGDLLIPRSIKHEKQEFIIVRIKKQAFYKAKSLKSIQFAHDSELRIIEKQAFFYSGLSGCITLPPHIAYIGYGAFMLCNINRLEIKTKSNLIIDGWPFDTSLESISIPSNAELKDNWCLYVYELKNIEIIDNGQKNINYYENKFLIGKSNTNSDEYDVLLFARRDLSFITIPSFIKKIAPSALARCTCEKIIIHDKVTEIGHYAFDMCNNLKTIEFAHESQIQLIDEGVFQSCAIDTLTIPSHAKKICQNAFSCCTIKTLKFPPNSELHTIDKCAFLTSYIEKITIPSRVKYINEKAFCNCVNLKSIEFAPNSELQTIENDAFHRSGIEIISIPSSVVELKENWLRQANKLKCINIIDNKKHNIKYYNDESIVGKTDVNCDEYDVLIFAKHDIKTVTIPPFIKIIGAYSFQRSLIESIIISDQVKEIRENAFSYCEQLKKIYFSENSKLEKIGNNAFHLTAIENIVIPSSVKEIYEESFWKCENLKSFEFHDGSILTQIHPKTFTSSPIKSLKIPPSVKKICNDAFYDCDKLEKLEFTENSQLQEIGPSAFKMSGIKSLTILPKFIELNDNWCEYLKHLTEINFIGNNTKYKWYDDKLLLGKSDQNSHKFDVIVFVRRDINEFTFPSFINKIAPYAFSQSKLMSISIPSRITEIGKGAFQNCYELTTFCFEKHCKLNEISKYSFSGSFIERINIPSRVTKINACAFSNCKYLKRIDIPINSKLQEIEEQAFYNCPVKYVFIPTHVTIINNTAFQSCKKIHLVEVADKSELKSINLKLFKNSKKAEFKIPSHVEIVNVDF